MLIAAGLVSISVFRDLDRTNTSLQAAETALQDTTATLRETRAALSESNAARIALVAKSNRLEQEMDGLQRANSGLTADRAALIGYLNDALEQGAALTDELTAAAVAYGDLQGKLTESEAQVRMLTGDKADLDVRLAQMTHRYEVRDSEYAALQSDHRDLLQLAGTAEELGTQVGDLQDEIAGLEERRQPLLLAMQGEWVQGFLCTGSMEPKLTCLDAARWTRPVSQDEIVTGTVIIYDNRACWTGAGGGRSAHRVVDIKVVDGVHHYWPKGDALPRADGCWVPYTAVQGYIIELQRGAVLENAELRDNVNGARAAYDSAWDAYVDVIEEYCGHREPQRCSVDVANALGRQAQSLWKLVEEASEHYVCWYANAADSRYPGHIPYTC